MKNRAQGFAMLGALMVMALLAIVSIAVLSNAGADRRRAIRLTRAEVRESCSLAGLASARNHFATHFDQWNTYFTNAAFNPVGGLQPTPATLAPIAAAHPELFIDLDGDGARDVYLFIRDNLDEFPPALANPVQDNDQNAIVGAVCISRTMVPRREDDTVDPDPIVVESLLSVTTSGGTYGPGTSGNYNTGS